MGVGGTVEVRAAIEVGRVAVRMGVCVAVGMVVGLGVRVGLSSTVGVVVGLALAGAV